MCAILKVYMERIQFQAAFEKCIKDREGEVKITFTVPLSDEHKARQVPVQQLLNIIVDPQEL